MSRGGRPRGRVPPEVQVQREKYGLEIELAEYRLQQQREMLVAELLKNPRVFYVVCMAGSAGIAWLGEVVKSASESSAAAALRAAGGTAPESTRTVIPNPFKDPLGFVYASSPLPVGGGVAMEAAQRALLQAVKNFTGDAVNWLPNLITIGGMGGCAFFSVLLILHEIFGGEGSGMGEGVAEALAGSLGKLVPI